MKSPLTHVLLLIGMSAAGAPAAAASQPPALIKSVTGDTKVTSGRPAATVPAQAATLVPQGARIETGAEAKCVVRLLPDNAYVDVHAQSAFEIKRIKSKGKRIRRLTLDKAEVAVGLKKKSDPVQCVNAQTVATGEKGRFSCRSDEKGVAVFLVQDGELSIYNRPKDITATARSGQKAVSDQDGIRVTDATDEELSLAGFAQNMLEVDFVNPQTEDFTTLEVEYETNF